jgi:cytochrome c oxidase cbb3-type subunit I/II
MIFGMLYYLIPRMWGTTLYSVKLANQHFLIGTVGILLYAIPMYWAGFSQSIMWKQFTESGQLQFQFMETVTHIIPMYIIRGIGGTLYWIGALMAIYNIYKTIKQGTFIANEAAEALPLSAQPMPAGHLHWHTIIERKPLRFLLFALIAVSIGGAVELIPTFMINDNIPTIAAVKPYTPLELLGRDIYIREGCYNCHSQMIRPFRDEEARYGEYSKAGEFVYDHPFQWGSKRTGPDLHRVGGKYPNSWHYNHMRFPQDMTPNSLMPPYPWLLEDELDISLTEIKIKTMRKLGVPYPEGYENIAVADLHKQADAITANLLTEKIKVNRNKEIIAVIAYLQRLGTDIKKGEIKK